MEASIPTRGYGNGINPNRLITRGYGIGDPIVESANSTRKLTRKSQFRITRKVTFKRTI